MFTLINIIPAIIGWLVLSQLLAILIVHLGDKWDVQPLRDVGTYMLVPTLAAGLILSRIARRSRRRH